MISQNLAHQFDVLIPHGMLQSFTLECPRKFFEFPEFKILLLNMIPFQKRMDLPGIEPGSPRCKRGVLPLDYRPFILIEPALIFKSCYFSFFNIN
jgi:hypothetical protein